MANVRDSDTSLWLHNKLGTSNDSWTSGSICSQLNKEVLRNIRDCFSDMQTQVKLKLLLSFFHIPRRLVEEWKSELDDIIEVAAADSELWVSMIAETIKTYPATGSLNTEISEFEETRPIFTDMGNDLKKLVNKHSDLGMLPLECLYLNKTTLTSIVGQQNTSVKHFTLKRKPKSATLRTELLQKSVDAQSLSLKKGSAPVIPLRSRGMPRKMTDTTPLKGIPSRMPTTGFKSPTSSSSQNVTSQNARPNISRPGRKDGGIKLLDITEQPLGYAQAKKRKKQQENEEQQKKLLLEIQTAEKEKKELSDANNCHTPDVKPTAAILTESNECVALASTPTSTPDYAAGLNASSVIYTQPATPLSIKTEFQSLASSTATTTQATSTVADNKKIIIEKQQTVLKVERIVKDETEEPKIIVSKITRRVADTVPTPVVSKVSISENCIVSSSPATISTIPNLIPTQQQPQKTTIIYSKNSQLLQQQHSASASSLIAKISQQQQLSQPSGVTYVTTTTDTAAILSSLPKSVANTLKQSPVKITQTTIMQAPGPAQQNHNKPQTLTIQGSAQLIQSIQQQQQQNKIQRFQIQTSNGNLQNIPALTSISSSGTNSTISLINNSQLNSINTGNVTINHNNFGTAPPPLQMQTNQGTKIVQIKTTPTNQINKQITNLQNLPPLIPTQSAALKMQQAHQQTQKILVTTTQPSMITSLPGQTTITQHQQPQQQKFTQVMMQIPTSNAGTSSSMKTGKTYILTAPNMLTQKAVLVSSVDADGNRVYQQIPISNLQDSSGGSVMPGLIKSNQQQTVSLVSGNQMHNVAPQQMPALVPTGQQQQLVIQQQPQQAGQTIIRPLLLSNSNQMQLPQGLTLIQRPGQQPQLVQTISQPQQQQQHQQIGQTQFQRVQLPSQIGQVQIRQQPTLIQIQQPQQQTQMPQQHTVQIQQIQQPQQQKVQMQQRPQQQIILTKTVAAPQHQQQQQQQPQQQQKTVQQRQNVTIVQHTNAQRGQPARKLLSLSSEHVSKANEIFRKANKVTRPDKALILGFMGGCRENPRPTPENILVIKLSEREEEVKQKDNSYLHMMVESLIKLDYNTGEWSTFQNARRIEKKSIVTQPTAKDQKKEAKVA